MTSSSSSFFYRYVAAVCFVGLAVAQQPVDQVILGADGHGQQNILGANGHGRQQNDDQVAILGADDHGVLNSPTQTTFTGKPLTETKHLLGADGHGTYTPLKEVPAGEAATDTQPTPAVVTQTQPVMLGAVSHGELLDTETPDGSGEDDDAGANAVDADDDVDDDADSSSWWSFTHYNNDTVCFNDGAADDDDDSSGCWSSFYWHTIAIGSHLFGWFILFLIFAQCWISSKKTRIIRELRNKVAVMQTINNSLDDQTFGSFVQAGDTVALVPPSYSTNNSFPEKARARLGGNWTSSIA